MAEQDLVTLFAVLLILGSVLLLFAPLVVRLLRSSLWALTFALAVPALMLAALGAAFVEASFTHPTILAPVVAVVFGARVVSPTLAFFKVRERYEATGSWKPLKWGLMAGFLLLGLYVLFNGFGGGASPADPVLFSERVLMAAGTAFVFLRLYLRVLPQGSYHRLVLWVAVILFSTAIAIVAPYAFPAYGVLYALSGVMGWLIGSAVALKSP